MAYRQDVLCSLEAHRVRMDGKDSKFRCPHKCGLRADSGAELTGHLEECPAPCLLRRASAALRHTGPHLQQRARDVPLAAAGGPAPVLDPAAVRPDPAANDAPAPAENDVRDGQLDAPAARAPPILMPLAAVAAARAPPILRPLAAAAAAAAAHARAVRIRLPVICLAMLAALLLIALTFDTYAQYAFQHRVLASNKQACRTALEENGCAAPVAFAQAQCQLMQNCVAQIDEPVQLTPILLDLATKAMDRLIHALFGLLALLCFTQAVL
ncbi:hypothetical protein OC834_005394 [Tilletia horrida]|nr:hypothetical protein OC834_005394 [Tilletia horrida]